jgi:hypothetical protein
MLNDNRCKFEVKEHHNVLEMTITCVVCRLPFVTFLDLHQIICATQINLGVHLCMIDLLE